MKLETLEDYGFCQPLNVAGRYSIADLFPEKMRSGIYVLSFADGAYYAGRTRNIVARYAAHNKTHGDIQSLTFKQLSEKDQNAFERMIIHLLERQGVNLRNQLEASIPYGESDLDTLIPSDDQLRWQQGLEIRYPKVKTLPRQAIYSQNEQFLTFKNHRHAEPITRVLKEYVEACLPAPELTEISFWSLSCLPSTRSNYSKKDICRVNIGRCEVLTIGEKLAYGPFGQDIFVAFHVARTPLEDDRQHLDIDELAREIPGLVPFDHIYRFGGQDQWAFFVQSIEGMEAAICHRQMRQAIRLFNLRCMQKRANMFARYHCDALAGSILNS